MITISPTAFGQTADLFASTVISFSVSAAWELGVLDELHEQKYVVLDDFAMMHDLHLPSLQALMDTLACSNVVSFSPEGNVLTGKLFDEIYESKGFFYWLTRGCGQLFANMPALIQNDERQGDFIHRDLRAVGVATRDLGKFFFDDPLENLLNELSFETIADLGCGSAERLIRITESLPNSHGVGIDISSSALQLAGEAIEDAGLEDRIALVRADARQLSPLRAFQDVDLLTCFLMGHDFWPRPECIASLQQIRVSFPNVETFVLCDTFRSGTLPTPHPSIFTPGFELAHAVMGVYLPTLDEWQGVFAESGWKCLQQQDIPVPPSTAMFVLTPL